MASPATTQGHVFSSPNNHSPVVHIVAWLGIVMSTLAILARMGTKWVVQHKVEWDDGAIMAAFSWFASNILFLVSLCFVKISVTLIIHFIKPFGVNQKLCRTVAGGTLIWALVSIFLASFQCSTPDTWNFIDNKCIDRAGYWTFINIASIFIDAALIIMPILVLRELHIRLQRKLLVMAVFSSRILVVGATLALVIITIRKTPTANPSFDMEPIALTTTVTMNLSIITACFPYLKPFLESLESGMIRSDDLFRRQGGSTTRYGHGYPLGPIANSSSKTSKVHTAHSTGGGIAAANVLGGTKISPATSSRESQNHLGTDRKGIGNQFENIARVTAESGKNRETDAESQSSQSRIIKQTTTWAVSRESSGA